MDSADSAGVPAEDVKGTEPSFSDSCEPCFSRNIILPATHYCHNCDEKYCKGCTIMHKTSKATRDHNLENQNMATGNLKDEQCEPCKMQNKNIPATSICGSCEEFLCDTCKTRHLSQRQNKTHKIKPIPDLLCEPCRFVDKRTKASSYCADCDEPEALCQLCAEDHKTMKKTKDHRLSSDMSTFIFRYKVDEKSDENVDSTGDKDSPGNDKSLLLCEPCKYKKQEVKATHKCEQCDEYLCEKCRVTHLSLKQTRNHVIKSISQSFMCDNCPDKDASFYCKDCVGPICDECVDTHKAIKLTRGHTLSRDITACILGAKMSTIKREFTEDKPLNISVRDSTFKEAQVRSDDTAKEKAYCEPCRFEEKEIDAVYFCKECDECLCDECTGFHKTDNQTHSISEIFSVNVMCRTCKSSNKDVQATVYCVDCDDNPPYCNACARKHSVMKKNRGHQMSDKLSSVRFSFQQSTNRSGRTKQTENPIKSKSEMDTEIKHAFTTCLTRTGIFQKTNDELGKPYSTECRSDRIWLQWSSNINLQENEEYKIIFKEHPNGRWKPNVTDVPTKAPRIVVCGLKAETPYVFKLRIVNDVSGTEGPYTKESDPICTKESPAQGILKHAEQIDKGPPGVFCLPIKENVSARNEPAKTRKLTLGQESSDPTEKTIMIVGATGCGKSTLINGMANYLMGVNWEDRFRFTLINLETVEKEREGNQALSQTEWITCYTLHSSATDRVDYTVNVIDTPGFGDTRGLDQDSKIVEQIRQLFTIKGEQGVSTLDAVCFILKAPDARLTATQRYIFESILALFGNDIKDNICTLVTFADGQKPPVLSAIEAMDGCPLPYKTYFTFNNSALYVDNTDDTPNNLSSFFWDMGTKSYQAFFNHLSKLQTRSLSLTSEVLKKRYELENTVINLQKEIDVGLSQINQLEKEAEIFTRNAEAILANKDFEYEVEEPIQEQIDLRGKGQYTTTCLTCNYTCHENCIFADNSEKARCCAMKNENCIQCPNGCHWSQHKNTPYIIIWTTRKVKKKYDEMKKKYEEATQKTLTQEQVLDQMYQDIEQQETEIQVMMEIIKKLNNRLKEIALRPDPLSMVQYIDLMISSEKREKKSGFEGRIEALHKCKKRATYGENVQIFQDRFRNTCMKIAPSDAADEILKKNESTSIMGSIKSFLGFGSKRK